MIGLGGNMYAASGTVLGVDTINILYLVGCIGRF